MRRPLGAREDRDQKPPPYAFLPAEGESLHQIPVGPVHAGIIEPGHFRFTANGETVVRLEERLGYVHKGIELLMTGAPLDKAARLAGRVSGDSTVAYGLAFARAVEAALDIEAPPRAAYLRALMAELERLANHLGDIGAICNDAAFALMHAQCGILRERVLRAADACFGHRLMMDRVVPGRREPRSSGRGSHEPCAHCWTSCRRVFPRLVDLYDNTASLQDRTATTGVLRAELARAIRRRRFCRSRQRPRLRRAQAARLPALRSARFRRRAVRGGRCERARLGPYPRGRAEPAVSSSRSCAACPPDRSRSRLTAEGRSGEGMALVEGFRGDVLAWLQNRRWSDRALLPARPVVVPVAAARGGDRGQHRRRLPALQQIVQLFVLGT